MVIMELIWRCNYPVENKINWLLNNRVCFSLDYNLRDNVATSIFLKTLSRNKRNYVVILNFKMLVTLTDGTDFMYYT